MERDPSEDRDYYTRMIVDSDAPKRVIIAGPGCGKTYTFRLALERGDSKGLALTFIRNLAADLANELSDVADALTFHGFCKQLLYTNMVDGLVRPHYYPPLYLIIESDLELTYEGANWDKHEIEKVLHNLEEDSELLDQALGIGTHYNAVSYVDSVYRVLCHFRDDTSRVPEYPLVVVDEYQDFSLLEKSFIDVVAERNRVLIAGDDDQALYAFKHATAQYIRELAGDGSGYERFGLPYCSRCTEVIVAAFHDVVREARREGLLANRLEKPFKCFLPTKAAESEAYPKIVHARCSVERTGCPYMGRYVAARIAEIPAEEIAESHRKNETTALVIGPSYMVNRVVPELQKRFANVECPKASEMAVEVLDGYYFLSRGEASALGWRILVHVIPYEERDAHIRQSIAEGRSLAELVPGDYKRGHLKTARLLGRFLDAEEELSETEERELSDRSRRSIEDICEHFGRPVPGNEKEEVSSEAASKLNADEPTILCTTLRGSKGRSAYYVFVVGMNNGHLPQRPDAIRDDEVRRFLVGLTRSRRKCYLVSVKRLGGDSLESSCFVDWIENRRLEREYMDKRALDELEERLGWT